MSSAFYPLGMHSYNNSSPFAPFSAPYNTWKGTGPYSYPVAITSGNIRPLTNNDPTNNAIQKFGLARPLKWQYRKGTSTQPLVTVINPNQPDQYIQVNRESQSSVGSSLVSQTIDQPGRYMVKHNPPDEVNEALQLNKDCSTCHGIGLVTSFSPEPYLTNNPEPVSCSPQLCCNEENKALNRVIYASTNLKKNYFNTHAGYMANRCQTYDQKAFNFYAGPEIPAIYAQIIATNPGLAAKIQNSKPGDPFSYLNMYVANCYPNTDPSVTSQAGFVLQLFQIINSANAFTAQDIANYSAQTFQSLADFNTFLQSISGNKTLALNIFNGFINNPNYVGTLTGPNNPRGCKLVVYKPSNPQFAVQGGVSSSTRTLKLTVDTIGSNLSSLRRLKGAGAVENIGGQPFVPFVYKTKVPPCNPGVYTKNGNPKTCFGSAQNDYMYKAFSKLGNIGGSINGTQVSQVGMSGANS
jgi:hypothetical protein